MTEIKDLIIIGAGPAGITAAVYAARKKMDFCLITGDIGGQAAWSAEIENYTGYQFITGPDLVAKFREHIEKYKFALKEGVEAKKVERSENGFSASTSTGETFYSRSIIIATGKKPKLLNVPGEKEFKNRGVTYCATCDGPIFAGKEVAVIGGGNSALDAALQMIKIASKVYVINNTEALSGDQIMQEKLASAKNAEVINKARVIEIKGEKFVNEIRVEVEGRSSTIPVQGVFIETGSMPNSDLIDLVKKNPFGEIMINCSSHTSCPGVFAAGDVTDVPEKQIIVAAGEGAKAALSAFRYISTH